MKTTMLLLLTLAAGSVSLFAQAFHPAAVGLRGNGAHPGVNRPLGGGGFIGVVGAPSVVYYDYAAPVAPVVYYISSPAPTVVYASQQAGLPGPGIVTYAQAAPTPLIAPASTQVYAPQVVYYEVAPGNRWPVRMNYSPVRR